MRSVSPKWWQLSTGSLAGLAGSEAGQRQVTHLVPGQTEPDTAAEAGHRADRDGYPPLAPEVTLVEQNVSHMVPAGNDGQPPDLPDGAVRGTHMLSAADFHFACMVHPHQVILAHCEMAISR